MPKRYTPYKADNKTRLYRAIGALSGFEKTSIEKALAIRKSCSHLEQRQIINALGLFKGMTTKDAAELNRRIAAGDFVVEKDE